MCLTRFRKVINSIPARGVHLYRMNSPFPPLKRIHPDPSVFPSGLRPSGSLKSSPTFFLLFPTAFSLSLSVKPTYQCCHWPFSRVAPSKNSFFLSHFLEGKWKVFWKQQRGRCCFMYGREDFWSRAPHISWVGVYWSSLIRMTVWTSPWRVEGKWLACVFTCFGALDTTKIRFKLLCCLFIDWLWIHLVFIWRWP